LLDDLLDEVVSLILVHSELDMNTLVLQGGGNPRWSIGGIENDGDGRGIAAVSSFQESQKRTAGFLQRRRFLSASEQTQGMKQVVAVDQVEHSPQASTEQKSARDDTTSGGGKAHSQGSARDVAELSRIMETQEKNKNNRLRATELGISRMTLYKKMHKYGLMAAG
jgi:hypothetical protein